MTDPAPGAEPASGDDETLFPRTAGERLRSAREAQRLTLADVAARTRVPIRHLEAIESGDYSDMPTPTYAIGFAKAYARAVGEDEVTIARDVRTKTAATSAERREYQPYELDDPTRVPPRGLALIAGAIALVVLIVALIWVGSGWYGGAPAPQPNDIAAEPQAEPPAVTAAVPAPAATAGQVTLTATARVWARVRDASGKTLFENTMNPGDHFDVPADADHPTLTVGRPDQLQVTLDGTALAPLGSGAQTIKNVPIDAAALSARQATAPAVGVTPPQAIATNAPTAAATTQRPSAPPTPRATRSPRPKPSASPSPPDLDLNPNQPSQAAPTGIY